MKISKINKYRFSPSTRNPTPINLTNRVESLHVAEEFSSGLVDKNNDVTPKNTIPNDKPKSLHSLGSVH